MKWFVLLAAMAYPEENEEECKKAVEAFRASYNNSVESARIDAVREVAKHQCEKTIGVLSQLLTGETPKVRIAAAKALGGYDHPKAVEAVAAAVLPNRDRHEVLEALAKALEDLDWEVGAAVLNPLLRKHDDMDILEALHIIVPVLGKMGSATSVEPLIKLLEHAENEGKRVRVGGKRYAGNPRLAALKGPIDKALQQITGGDQSSSDKWDDWWKANRERLLAGATVIYRCKATGKRWGQRAGEPQECPNHDKPQKDGQPVKVKLH